MKKFKLFWKDILVGDIEEISWDMRSSGNIIYCFDYENEQNELKRLSNYIKLSIEGSKYLDAGDELNYEKNAQETEMYMDMIECEDWYLINKENERVGILSPIFHDGNEITWQIDYRK